MSSIGLGLALAMHWHSLTSGFNRVNFNPLAWWISVAMENRGSDAQIQIADAPQDQDSNGNTVGARGGWQFQPATFQTLAVWLGLTPKEANLIFANMQGLPVWFDYFVCYAFSVYLYRLPRYKPYNPSPSSLTKDWHYWKLNDFWFNWIFFPQHHVINARVMDKMNKTNQYASTNQKTWGTRFFDAVERVSTATGVDDKQLIGFLTRGVIPPSSSAEEFLSILNDVSGTITGTSALFTKGDKWEKLNDIIRNQTYKTVTSAQLTTAMLFGATHLKSFNLLPGSNPNGVPLQRGFSFIMDDEEEA
jgi:hypothetical protein